MAKIMQAECNQVCLKLLRRSLSYTKVQIKSKKCAPLRGIFQTVGRFNILLGKIMTPRLVFAVHHTVINTARQTTALRNMEHLCACIHTRASRPTLPSQQAPDTI